jgi:protein-disulfide isomerase
MLDERRQRTTIEPGEWAIGAEDARATLLEYGDFQCPHCAAARALLEHLVLEDPTRVRLVYRHFPVSTIHPAAQLAAEAAEAAGAAGRFWEMHETLFEHQDRLDFESLCAYARALGLPEDDFELALTNHVYAPEVRRDFRAGVTDGVNGTPTLFLNGRRYDGPRAKSPLLAAVERTLGV